MDPRSKFRLVVPNSSCGGIIGKGGATIKYEFYSLYVSFPTLGLQVPLILTYETINQANDLQFEYCNIDLLILRNESEYSSALGYKVLADVR